VLIASSGIMTEQRTKTVIHKQETGKNVFRAVGGAEEQGGYYNGWYWAFFYHGATALVGQNLLMVEHS
jgi:hypothetical protein